MNRLTSLLAGGATAAVSGAVIAAAAAGQGVFDSPSKPQPKQDQVAATSTWSDPTAVADQQSAMQAVQPRIVYVDKEPIVVTRTYQQPVAGSSALSTETASPMPAVTPTVAPPPMARAVPAAEPAESEPRVQQLPPASTPQDVAPTATAPTQPPAAATASTRPREDDHRTTTATTGTPTAGGGEHERDD